MHYAPIATDSPDDLQTNDNAIDNDMSPLLWKLTFVIAVSGLLFGYDTAVISTVLVVIRNDLGHDLSQSELEVIVSSTTIGALLGALASGTTGNIYGRRWTAILSCIIFIAGGLIQAFAISLPSMVIGRFIVGLAVGLASMIVPLYISEIVPSRHRGRLVTINVLMITLGQVLAYIVDYLLFSVPHGWRWMVGSSVLPSVLQLVGLQILPESPRWLASKNCLDHAQNVYELIYPTASVEVIKMKLSRLQDSFSSPSVHTSLTSPAFLVACGLQASQQLCGFNTAMYYSPIILRSAGFTNASLFSILVALCNFVFTYVALTIIDRIGRRAILLYSIIFMTFSLASLATSFIYVSDTAQTIFPSVIALLSLLSYVSAYALGLGNVPWLYQSELGLDARAISISSAINWSTNLLTGATFLSASKSLGSTAVFSIYAAFCVAIWLFVYTRVPETARLPVEDIQALFSGHGDIISQAAVLQRSK